MDNINQDEIKQNLNENNEKETNLENEKANEIIKNLENEKKELQDKYIRLVAEFDNFKKRNAKEKIDLIQTAGKEIIISLLDILDDTERATKQFEQEVEINQIKDGINLVFNKFRNILLSKGLKKIESKGNEFDLEKHEAITEIEVDETNKNKVIEVVQEGYLLNEKIIRFAKVVVGK